MPTPDRTPRVVRLKVMADYRSSGVWAVEWEPRLFRLGMLSREDAPHFELPEELWCDLQEWIGWYDGTLSFESPLDTPPWPEDDRRRFNERGLELARRVKAHVGPDVAVEHWTANDCQKIEIGLD